MKISVITICLNAEQYIRVALASVAGQSWPELEHIVVDGGSTDTTLNILREVACTQPRLRWSSTPDNGISDAMNRGLTQVTGDVVAFLHSDDLYPHPEVLALVARWFGDHPEAEWLTGGLNHIDQTGQPVRSLPVRRWSYRRLVRGNIIFHPATFVRSSVLKEVGGFDTSLRHAMDYELWLRLGARSAPLLLDQPLASFRLHPGSRSVEQVDAAFLEEMAVRWRHLRGKPLQQGGHLLYFALKYLPNRLSVRCGNGC